MLRVILKREVQSGPERSEPVYQTIDIEAPDLEAHLQSGANVVGIEVRVVPAREGSGPPPVKADIMKAAQLGAQANSRFTQIPPPTKCEPPSTSRTCFQCHGQGYITTLNGPRPCGVCHGTGL